MKIDGWHFGFFSKGVKTVMLCDLSERSRLIYQLQK